MKLFELVFANLRKFVAAEDADQAKAIGEDPVISPELHFRPFEVIEIQVEGYDITVTPVEAEPEEEQPHVPPESPESEEGTNDTQDDVNDSQEDADTESEASEEDVPGAGEPLSDMTKEELRAWLDEREIEYVPQWGEKRLRELVLQHLEK